ncbi:ABC transporter substrate-binding protein [Telmatospirillum sp.]|uniref:ABC transporter substrate-binding protein n=1 Tax=Telmatospirillum sp. TaxID=2079197 RepID=UPI00283BEE90|nr:ABC transporter substrate-binding protein [Telmatospirillum sp.]MDR3440051.1 ABC transporter substrate-binding protein [Telmatospirillum sp.]
MALRLLAVLTVAAQWLAVPAVAADVVVGFVGDLSGVGANVAQDQLDGFRLGIKHLGGRLGGNDINLVVADSRRDGRTAHQAMERMQQVERVQVVLVSSEAAVVPSLLPLAIAGKAIMISLSPPLPSLAGKDCSSSFFSLAGLVETMHDLGGQYLQQRGYKHVVFVGPDNAATQNAAAMVRRGFKGQVTMIASPRGAMDFTKSLRAIREAAPDAIYLLHTGGMAVNFVRQMVDFLGKDHPPLFGPATTLDQPFLAAFGPAISDAWSVAPWSEDFDVPTSRRVLTDFESDYGRPASFSAMVGYDAAMLLDVAFRSVDKKVNDMESLRGALKRVEFPSTRGSFRFDTNQFPIQSYVARQVISDPRERMVNEQRGMFQKDVRDGHAGECPLR